MYLENIFFQKREICSKHQIQGRLCISNQYLYNFLYGINGRRFMVLEQYFKTFHIYVHKNYHDKHHIPDEESGPPSCKTPGNDGWVFEFWIRISFGCNFWCKRNAFVESPLLFFCKTVNLYTGHLFKILLQLNFRFRQFCADDQGQVL